MALVPNHSVRRLSVVHNALAQPPARPSQAAGSPAAADALMDPTSRRPTQAGIDLFWEQGYLVLPGFLAAEHVARLSVAFESLVDRRRELHARGIDPLGNEQGWANGDQFPPAGEQGPSRVFGLLHEPGGGTGGEPIFLDLLDHPPSLAWVHALLNAQPHVHSTDGYLDVVRGDPTEAWKGYGAGW